MRGRIFLLGLGVLGLLTVDVSRASAQVVNDFLCSTFSYKCNQQPALPPPQLAPAEAPKPAAPKHAAHKHKAKPVAKADASKQAATPPAPAAQ